MRNPKYPALKYSDTIALTQDPVPGEYLAYHKRPAKIRGFGGRVVWLARSRDFQTWTEPELVFVPDEEGDRWASGPDQRTEVYNMLVYPHASGFIGLPTMFVLPPRSGPRANSRPTKVPMKRHHASPALTMKRTPTFLTPLLLVRLAALRAADKQPTKPGLALTLESERDTTSLTTPGEPRHAATIAQTTSGAIPAAWWSGMELAPETDIWMSRFDPVIRSPRRQLRTRTNLRRSLPGEDTLLHAEDRCSPCEPGWQ